MMEHASRGALTDTLQELFVRQEREERKIKAAIDSFLRALCVLRGQWLLFVVAAGIPEVGGGRQR
ncbi:MAG TPA: hypothetical protein VJ722_11620 [Rhodanobacteraceae bacterium]|nr:hypothetical protein [Rhodanobacteraceae bacterium]